MRISYVVAAAVLAGWGACTSLAQPFLSQGIELLSQRTPQQLGSTTGNDCWGHVSPSGREYALMGLRDRLAVVEITNPASPVHVGSITHPASLWGDVKSSAGFCYVVNETGGGMQVIDLRNVDAGQVTLVQSVTGNGLTHSHNVALNPDSGFVYLCGSDVSGSGGGLVAYSLADPANPVLAGMWTTRYVHDAQIVTYTSGPYAGREIAFCACEEFGVYIVDVTNKANMVTLGTLAYPGVTYCHQVWLSEDKQHLYVNDELDGPAQGFPRTFTRVVDVTNLNAPTLVGGFTSGVPGAIDHNLYVHQGRVFEANYTSGLRVFDATNPTSPVEVAWIDTHPDDNDATYDGAWSTYPYFPSGSIIISDINRGLFVVRLNLNYLTFAFPDGLPQRLDPFVPNALRVTIGGLGDGVDTASVQLWSRIGGGAFTPAPMTLESGATYLGYFPVAPCLSTMEFYVTARNTSGTPFAAPLGAPGWGVHSAPVNGGTQTLLFYDMETAAGWTGGAPGDTATAGLWERGDPQGTIAQPEDDHTPAPGVNCWVTGRLAGSSAGAHDVDGGYTTLMSPVMNLGTAGSETRIGYWRWYSNSAGSTPNTDIFRVDLSNDAGTNWASVEVVGPSGPGTSGGWLYHEFRVADILPLTSQMRLRFIAEDAGAGSLVEAALDDLSVFGITCPTCPSDFNGSGGTPDDADVAAFFEAWNNGDESADLNQSGGTPDDADVAAFFEFWNAGC
ncbi:MAG: choice-of-anchor B family protein [Phycisphaerales bacterium]|nr:choice-of-anchor B family protein [Phycisphaerales bacterium]